MRKNLGKHLKSDNTEIRRQAIEELRSTSDESDIPLLLEAMKDSSWRVRKTATEILKAQFETTQYIKGIIALLYIEDNAGARNSAIDLLVSLRRIVVPYLIDAFQTDNHDVRKFIIDVLGEISDKRSLSLMLNALKDEDENVKASAVEHLGKLKEPSVVDALMNILKGDDLWIAYPAADALGKIGDKRAIPPLVEALNNKTLREPALRALATFADPDTLGFIIPLLKEGARSVKEEALRTINEFYKRGVSEETIVSRIREYLGADAFDILLKFAWSNKNDIRMSAILLLGLLKDIKAVQPLLDMSAEEDFRDEIKRALVFIGRAMPDHLIRLIDNLNIVQRRFLTEVAVETKRSEFLGLFEKFLEDEDGHVRAFAACGLAGIGDSGLVEKILGLLNDPYEDVQEAAVDAAVKLKGSIKLKNLLQSLSSDDPRIRKNVTLILGKIDAKEAVKEVGFLVKDPDTGVRKAAVVSLSMITAADNLRYLKIALTDEISDIRVTAAYALGMNATKESTDALILLLSDQDESVRVAAIKALGSTADERALEPLVEALSDVNGFVVAAAIEALGRMVNVHARDAIMRMLSSDDDEIKRTAVRSLSHFDGVREKIIPFLSDPDWATRKIAVEILGKSPDGAVMHMLETLYDEETDPIVKNAIEDVLNVA